MHKCSSLNSFFLASVLLCFILSFVLVNADGFLPEEKYVYNRIYTQTGTAKPCVRLLSPDGIVGCSTPASGTYGSLYPILTQEDYTTFISTTSSSWFDPKAILLAGELLNKTIIDNLHDMGNVEGVLVMSINAANHSSLENLFPMCGNGPMKGFSPDDTHPNRKWGLHPNSTYEWNPCGSSWMNEEVTIPMFHLNVNDSLKMLDKALSNKNNGESSWPKWTVEFNAFMHGAIDSETCLRRGFCDPVGGQSVFTGMNDYIDDSKNIILIMTSMDSTAMFHDLAVGAQSDSAGVAALLGAMGALSSHASFISQLESSNKEVIFGFWEGESYGYLGSRKFVDDITPGHFKCDDERHYADGSPWCKHPFKSNYNFKNISIDRVEAIVEINQIALSLNGQLYIHREKGNPDDSLVNLLMEVAESGDKNITLATAFDPVFELPPSSLHSFLRAKSSIPGVVISDFNATYNNNFYHSRLDNADYLRPRSNNYSTICQVATFIARTAYALILPLQSKKNDDSAYHNIMKGNNVLRNWTDNIPADLTADCNQVIEIMECLVDNNNCDLKRNIFNVAPKSALPQPTSQYTGVFRWTSSITLDAKFVYNMASVLTSRQPYLPAVEQVTCNTTSQCPKGMNMSCIMHLCRNSSTDYHDAVSTGIDYDRDWNVWKITDDSVPMWTESRWDSTGLRIFQADSYTFELFVLFFGILEFLTCYILFWFARKALRSRFSSLR